MPSHNPLVYGCLWISRLAWINICWLIFTLLGLGLTGIFPASVVALQMTRRYLQGSHRVSFLDFATEWKKEWWRSNTAAWPLAFISVGLFYLAWGLVTMNESTVWVLLMMAGLPIALCSMVILFSVLIELSVFTCSIKQSWMNGLLLLQEQIWIVLVGLFVFGLMLSISMLMPIYGVFFLFSPVALLSMVMYMKARPRLFEENE